MGSFQIKLLSSSTLTHLENASKKLGIPWIARNILAEALTTRAYQSENQGHAFRHQQWLEFIGDGVLTSIVRSYVVDRLPGIEVSHLTRICADFVENRRLEEVGEKLELRLYLLPLNKNNTPRGILADTYEALIGACFTDGGYEKAQEFVHRTYLDVYYPTVLRL
jgi:ribonuclease-3